MKQADRIMCVYYLQWIFSNSILKTGKVCLDLLECCHFSLSHCISR